MATFRSIKAVYGTGPAYTGTISWCSKVNISDARRGEIAAALFTAGLLQSIIDSTEYLVRFEYDETVISYHCLDIVIEYGSYSERDRINLSRIESILDGVSAKVNEKIDLAIEQEATAKAIASTSAAARRLG